MVEVRLHKQRAKVPVGLSLGDGQEEEEAREGLKCVVVNACLGICIGDSLL